MSPRKMPDVACSLKKVDIDTINAIKCRRSIKRFGPSFQMTSFEMKQSTAAFNAQTLMLAACPMLGLAINDTAQLINLPGQHVISICAVIAKATKEAWGRPESLELNDGMVSDLSANRKNHPEPCPE
jgi:hypothetical protein